MPVLMFKEQFAAKVERGEKLQTIRPPRKRPIKPGDKLSLRKWSGAAYRSKHVKLREATCERVSLIVLDETPWEFVFEVDGRRLVQDQWAKLAREDGFNCTTEMLDWFKKTHGLPFEGVMIQWA